MNYKITILSILICSFAYAQDAEKIAKKEAKVKAKALSTSKNLTWEGNKELSEDNFVQAEGNYRKAISKSNENAAAPFNLGTAYYNKETYSEAFGRFKQAGEIAKSKADKHKAYHNMGNVFMKNKEYEKAVEGYKEALRNNPTDEETRYNLALAKELLKKQQDEEKKNEDKKDKDKKDEDKKDQNKDGDKEKDDKGKEDENKDGEKDKKDKGDEGEEKNEKEKEGDQKKDQSKKPNEGDKPKEEKKPRPNQLSKQQIKNLLQAMQNEEKKVQKKMDAKKVKGVKVKSEKDW